MTATKASLISTRVIVAVLAMFMFSLTLIFYAVSCVENSFR